MEYSIWQQILTSVVNPKALHMAPKNDHMEYSMWHKIVTTWSTPWGCKNKSCGVLCISSTINILYNVMKNSIWPQISAKWSTPYGIIKQHMEYYIWQQILTSMMNPKALYMAPKNDHMEYSMWHEIVITWSTPCGLFFMPHGVLHMAKLESIFYPRQIQTCINNNITIVR